MRPARPLRVAILTHSTNPRGGVVHALELGDALVRLGHEAVVHAPDPHGRGFFRTALADTVAVPATPACGSLVDMVGLRVADYIRHFAVAANRRFDIFHAQDSISANALATLKARGVIQRFVRTVHHVDAFDDPRLTALQTRAIVSADRHLVVSRTWQRELAAQFGVQAVNVGNGVDTARYSGVPDDRDAALRQRLGVAEGPVFLSVGGVEERKNTLRILAAFRQVQAARPAAQLVIAGGASLLDHQAYQDEFAGALAASALPPRAVIRSGPVPQDDMPALYRAADVLAFPSIREGFGLVVLEAMASQVPVVTSRIAPFTEYLADDDAVWCDPFSVDSIAAAMTAAIDPIRRAVLVANGARVAARHDWRDTASAHLDLYADLRERHHA
jgi:glycosyltransferase-like protein